MPKQAWALQLVRADSRQEVLAHVQSFQMKQAGEEAGWYLLYAVVGQAELF